MIKEEFRNNNSYQRKFDPPLWNVVQPVTQAYHVFTIMDAIKSTCW